MDLICDLPVTRLGFKHILVTVCYLSKYVLARPLKTKTSEEVIQQLKDIYLEVGLPKVIQHDQGKEFTSNVSTITIKIFRNLLENRMSFQHVCRSSKISTSG